MLYSKMKGICFAVLISGLPLSASADAPVVEHVRIDAGTVYVTLSHADTGWEHYADGWEVLDVDGKRLGFRELLHPHVNEQPFTRSLSGVDLPDGATKIYIRARDNVTGWSDDLFEVVLAP
jgi:hypothetical protein